MIAARKQAKIDKNYAEADRIRVELLEKGITLVFTEKAVAALAEKSFSVKYGARNLRRTIQKELEDPISEKIIDSFENPISAIAASVTDGNIVVTTQ